MKKYAALALVTLALAGCSSAAPEAPAQPLMAPTTATAESAAESEPTLSPDPEIDYSQRVTAEASGVDPAVDARYLGDIREWAAWAVANGRDHTLIAGMSDQALLGAASEACAQLPGVGGAWGDTRLLDGEIPDGGVVYWDSQSIAARASVYYCTEWEPDLVVPWEPGAYS